MNPLLTLWRFMIRIRTGAMLATIYTDQTGETTNDFWHNDISFDVPPQYKSEFLNLSQIENQSERDIKAKELFNSAIFYNLYLDIDMFTFNSVAIEWLEKLETLISEYYSYRNVKTHNILCSFDNENIYIPVSVSVVDELVEEINAVVTKKLIEYEPSDKITPAKNIGQKIMFLYEIGVFDFIKEKYSATPNRTAEILSIAIGESPSTTRRCYSDITSVKADTAKNNPYNNENNRVWLENTKRKLKISE